MYICTRNNNKQKHKTMRTLTTEQAKRVAKELENTKNLLAKEMKMSEDLRYMDNVIFYNKHILKLENMLISKKW